MSIFKILSRLFAIFGLMTIFTISAWSTCTGELIKDWTTSTTPYSSGTRSVLSGSADQNYYIIHVNENGSISVPVESTSSKGLTVYLYNSSDCSGLISTTAIGQGNTSIVSIDPITNGQVYSIRFVGAHASQESTYNLTMSLLEAQTPPLLVTPIPDQTLTVNTAMVAVNLESYFAQTNGDTISYSLTGTLPAGLSYNATTHVISGTPTSVTGATNFTVTATDNDGSTSDIFSITVNPAAASNHSPIISPSVMTVSFPDNTAVTTTMMDVNATDIDLDTLTYAITAGNVSGTFGINSVTGVISLNSTLYAGVYTLTVTVSDGQGGSTTGTVTVNATSENGGGGTTPNPDECGMFPSVLSAQNNITSTDSAPIVCSLSDLGNVNNDVTVINVMTVNATSATIAPGGGCAVLSPPPPIALPTFLSTNVVTTQTISTATASFSSANIGNITLANGAGTVTFTATAQPYTDSSIRVMKIGNVDDGSQNNIVYIFNEGDYWIKNWNMAGNNAEIRINGHVRFFIENDFTANSNGLTINASPYSGIVNKFYMYSYQDIALNSSGNSNFQIYGYLYAAENITASGNSQNQEFVGAFRAGNNIDLQSNQTFTYNSSGSSGNAEDCIVPDYNLTGPYDAWDTFRNTLPLVSDRHISTKIASQEFNLTIGSLNNAQTAVEAKPSGILAYYRLYDFDTNTPKTTYSLFDANASASITTNPSFNIPSISKNMKVQFKFCADFNQTTNTFALKPNAECGGVSICNTPNTVCYRETVSSDAFAIRPKVFYNNLTPNMLLHAGVAQGGIIFEAHDENGVAALDYNESEFVPTPPSTSPSFVVDVNISDSSKVCAQPSLNFNPRVSFSNGIVTTNSYSVNNVGDFNVTMHEILGYEYAHIDENDTVVSDRLIGESNATIKVIPDHFMIDGNLTNGSSGFTYLSNFTGNGSADRNVSALLDANITAKAFDGTTTMTNYTSSCYAKNGHVSLAITLPTITPSGHLSKMLWYDDLNSSIDGNLTLGSPYTPLDYPALRFMNGDSNGTGNVRYRLNFDRNQTMLVDPFTMIVNEVNATDSDLVDGNKTLTANNSAFYVYGRIVPRDIRVFGANSTFTANAWYEVYNASSINGTLLPASRNDANWYTNTLHSDTVSSYDGDGNVTVVNTASTNIGGSVGNDGMEDYVFTGGMALGGYKAHINTDPWLWYGVNALGYLDPDNATNLDCMTHPCFNINIVPPVGATGSAKSGAEGNKASKKSDSSGWRSTSDYAPAVR